MIFLGLFLNYYFYYVFPHFQFVFHSNGYKELHEMLGADCLPSEYDGNDGPIDYDKSMKFILGREKIYARNRQFGYKS